MEYEISLLSELEESAYKSSYRNSVEKYSYIKINLGQNYNNALSQSIKILIMLAKKADGYKK